ncbi:MAG: radical SAM protein [Pseudomonadota bacterium]
MKNPDAESSGMESDSVSSRACGSFAEPEASVKLRPKPRLDKPFKLTICVTQTCNMDCKLCYADCGSAKQPELTTEQWKAFIDELVEQNVLHIFFEGGEPFDRSDFEDILGHASGKLFIAVRTHATMIDASRAKRLKAMGIGRLYVDLFSPEAHVQDDLTCTPGSFEASVEGMKQALAAGLKVTILGILSRKNYHALQDYISLAETIGADQVGILRLYPLGRAKKNWAELSLTLEEMMEALNALRVSDSVQLMQSWHPRDGNCCWQTAAVSPTGESIGCPYMREYVDYGNITEVPFLKTWDHPTYRLVRSSEVDEACPECSATQGSHGGCRATAFAFRGRLTASDPYCVNTNRGVDLRDLPERLIHKDA